MAGTVADLHEAIKSKRYEISLSRENIRSVQEDLKSKKRSLQELELEVATLERALSILQGQRNYVSAPPIDGNLPLHTPRRGSGRYQQAGAVFILVEQILRVEERPMTAGELLPLLIAKRAKLGLAPVSKEGMTGVLYRFAKHNRMFSYLGAGKFGLREWNYEKKQEGGVNAKGSLKQTA